jgi:hypothetical protein
MKYVILVFMMVSVFCPLRAQGVCEPQCESQLLRVEIANNVLNAQPAQGEVPAPDSPSPESVSIDSNSLTSEFGISGNNLMNQLALLECAAMAAAGRPIPPNHACIGLPTPFDGPITTQSRPNPHWELSMLSSQILGTNVTSERIKQRLLAIREDFLNREPRYLTGHETPEDLVRDRAFVRQAAQDQIDELLTPMIDLIANNQLRIQMPSILEIHNSISNTGNSHDLATALPGICNERSSPHANRSIPNCPVQVYADLNEFNNLLAEMWESGRMCTSGRGRFQPERENGERMYKDGLVPLGTGGCAIDAGRMKCYIKAPPRLSWDSATRKYKTTIGLESCHHRPNSHNMGQFRSDFDVSMSFSPSLCDNGDFCVKNPSVNWSIVWGTQMSDTFITRNQLHGINSNSVGDSTIEAISNVFRLPLSAGVGPVVPLSLEADGRVDAGSGFFGACFRPREGSARAE